MLFNGISKKNLQTINAEDATVADFAALAGGEQLHVAPTAVKIVAQGDAVLKVEDFAVGLPYVEVYGVAAVEHGSCRVYVDGVWHGGKG